MGGCRSVDHAEIKASNCEIQRNVSHARLTQYPDAFPDHCLTVHDSIVGKDLK